MVTLFPTWMQKLILELCSIIKNFEYSIFFTIINVAVKIDFWVLILTSQKIKFQHRILSSPCSVLASGFAIFSSKQVWFEQKFSKTPFTKLWSPRVARKSWNTLKMQFLIKFSDHSQCCSLPLKSVGKMILWKPFFSIFDLKLHNNFYNYYFHVYNQIR